MEGGDIGGDENRKRHAGTAGRERLAGLQLPQGEGVPVEGEDHEALDGIGMYRVEAEAIGVPVGGGLVIADAKNDGIDTLEERFIRHGDFRCQRSEASAARWRLTTPLRLRAIGQQFRMLRITV